MESNQVKGAAEKEGAQESACYPSRFLDKRQTERVLGDTAPGLAQSNHGRVKR